MEIERAKKEDLEGIYALTCALVEKELDWGNFREVFLKNIQNNQICYFIAKNQEKMAGYISVHIYPYLHHAGKVAEIGELVVLPRYQNEKIGTMLYEKALEAAKEKGCLQIEVCCNVLRERTHGFYGDKGMKRYHYKFSGPLEKGTDDFENRLGR